MSQRHSALISSDSEYFQVCFSAVHYLKISEQRWKRKFSELKISAETALIFSETALVFLIHSETALISAEIYEISETALFSSDLLWDLNPGKVSNTILPRKYSLKTPKLRFHVNDPQTYLKGTRDIWMSSFCQTKEPRYRWDDGKNW